MQRYRGAGAACVSLDDWREMGWETGIEPATFGATGLNSDFVLIVFIQIQISWKPTIGKFGLIWAELCNGLCNSFAPDLMVALWSVMTGY